MPEYFSGIRITSSQELAGIDSGRISQGIARTAPRYEMAIQSANRQSLHCAGTVMKTFLALFLVGNLFGAETFPGKKGNFHGFTMFDFRHGGVNCKIVAPKIAAEGKPWIWRARFWGHEPQLDTALLKRGWHVAYCDVSNLFGSPKAVKRWDAFYQFAISKHGFHKRPVLEGMSRGGLIIYNWAKANPGKVTCIYGDAPVCDFKSWPAGKGKGKQSSLRTVTPRQWWKYA